MANSSPPILGRAPIQDWPPWNPDGTIKNSWLAWFTGVTSAAQNASTASGSLMQNLLGIIPKNVDSSSVIITSVGLAMSLLTRQLEDQKAQNLALLAQALHNPRLCSQLVDRFSEQIRPSTIPFALSPEQAILTALLCGRPAQNSSASGLTQSLSTFLPGVEIGGSSTGIVYSSQLGYWLQIGNLNVLSMVIELSDIGSNTGNVTIVLPSPLPVAAHTAGGFFTSFSGMLLLSGDLTAEILNSESIINLYSTGATGSAALTNANLANGCQFNLTVIYQN